MGYKNIMISSYAKLSVKNQQLVLEQRERESQIPMEDINCILLEDRTISLTAYLLQLFAEYGIALFTCDEKHIPNAVLLPLVKHSRHYKMLRLQISICKPLQKRLWQQIVVQKIDNQSRCLQYLNKTGALVLKNMEKEVLTGDKSHVEAKAAAFYFRELVSPDFYRNKDSIINAALNYGYAILRGLIARTLICYGFEPSIGLFHHSELNSYNLADDFIEPFRPIVDQYVLSHLSYEDEITELTPEIKRGLFEILSYDMKVEGEEHSVSNSIDKAVMSFNGCLLGTREALSLPVLSPQKVHQYE